MSRKICVLFKAADKENIILILCNIKDFREEWLLITDDSKM